MRALAMVLVLGLASTANAEQVVQAQGGTTAQIQAALNALTGPGVVVVPPGNFLCPGTVLIPRDDVTLIGAGAGETLLFRSTDLSTAIIQSNSHANIRVSGFSVSGNAAPGSDAGEEGIAIVDGAGFRVDHCEVSHTGNSGIESRGDGYGVVDHCSVHDIYKAPIMDLGYGVVVYGDGTITGTPFGSDQAVFVEDSQFSMCRHAVASNSGARYVFRDNHVSQDEVAHAIDAHGAESGSPVGTEWIDVHDNLVESPVPNGFQCSTCYTVRIRGGQGLVWNNTFSGYDAGVYLSEDTPEATGPVNIWNNTLLPASTTPVISRGSLGTPVYALSAPIGYTPYAYPHPLTTNVVVDCGPDLVAQSAGSSADVYVDGSNVSASAGSVDTWHWYVDGQLASTCERAILPMAAGNHTVLLHAIRTDGLAGDDVQVVRVDGSGPIAATSSWNTVDFLPRDGQAEVQFSLSIPRASTSAIIGLTDRRIVGSDADTAIALRVQSGALDAWNGTAYAHDAAISLTPGTPSAIDIRLDVAAGTYSVTVDGAALATGYAFRTAVGALSRVAGYDSSGATQLGSFQVSGAIAANEVVCISDGGLWDAGSFNFDAGSSDAGSVDLDAGAPFVDAGTPIPDAGFFDAGSFVDAGSPLIDAGEPMGSSTSTSGGSTGSSSAPVDAGAPSSAAASSGCGCQSVDPMALGGLLFALAMWRRRR